MTCISVLCSGSGSNLQALIDGCGEGRIAGEIALVIANRRSAYALERAAQHGIRAVFISKKEDPSSYDERMLKLLEECGTELLVLAGFLSILGPKTLAAYEGKILNIHPALLPSFGGVGMYGHHVHEAVLAAGCKVSGATVHFVTSGVDEGPIVMQRAVDVLEGDTAETLAARVLSVEHQILPAAVDLFCRGRLSVDGKRVSIR